jgi:hypothetical protein
MKHLKPIAAGVGVLLAAAIIAGCGGGSGSGTLAGVNPATGSSGNTTTTQSSATQAVTITVTIPPAAQTASYRRNPAYVSPATTSISATAYPNNVSATGPCSGSTCTLTIAAPLTTTSILIQLFGSNSQLLSMATAPVTIHAGQANTIINLVFNGIVSTFHVFATLNAQQYPGTPNSGTVTVVPYDAAGDEIMAPGPGSLIDSGGTLLVSSTGSPQTLSLNATNLTNGANDTPYLTLGPLTWNVNNYNLSATATYNDGGAGTDDTVSISATSSASSAFTVVPFTFNVAPMAISVIANSAQAQTGYQVQVGALADPTTPTTIELPVVPTPPAVSPVTVYLSVVSNYNNVGHPLALTNDTCTTYTPSNSGLGLDAAFPSPAPTMGPTLAYPFTLNISAPAPTGSNMSCTFTITDTTSSLSAAATFKFDDTQVNITGKSRK